MKAGSIFLRDSWLWTKNLWSGWAALTDTERAWYESNPACCSRGYLNSEEDNICLTFGFTLAKKKLAIPPKLNCLERFRRSFFCELFADILPMSNILTFRLIPRCVFLKMKFVLKVFPQRSSLSWKSKKKKKRIIMKREKTAMKRGGSILRSILVLLNF